MERFGVVNSSGPLHPGEIFSSIRYYVLWLAVCSDMTLTVMCAFQLRQSRSYYDLHSDVWHQAITSGYFGAAESETRAATYLAAFIIALYVI